MTQKILTLLALALVLAVLGSAPFWPHNSKTQIPQAAFEGRRIDSSTWHLSASTVQQRIGLVVDGDVNTRWDSGKPQAGDEWIEIDLGTVQRIAQIILEQNVSTNDYPRGYAVEVSTDRKRPLTQVAAATVEGPRATLSIELPETPMTRIVRIRQTGHSPTQFWSVHEMYITGVDLQAAARSTAASELWRFWIFQGRSILLTALGACILILLGPCKDGAMAAWLLPSILGEVGYYCYVLNLAPLAWTMWLWAGGLWGPLLWGFTYKVLMKELETRPYRM